MCIYLMCSFILLLVASWIIFTFGSMNSAALNIYIQVFSWVPAFSFLSCMLKMELLSHMEILFLIFWELSNYHTGCAILHYSLKSMKVLISPYTHQHPLFSLWLSFIPTFLWLNIIIGFIGIIVQKRISFSILLVCSFSKIEPLTPLHSFHIK